MGFLVRIETVRGLAALAVALGHTMGFLLQPAGAGRSLLDQPNLTGIAAKLAFGLVNGETAVIVFFVISGVVIGRSLDSRPLAPRGSGLARDYAAFLLRRALRLYPAHVVALLGIVGLGMLFLAAAPDIDFAAFPGSAPAHDSDLAGWLNGEIFDPPRLRSLLANLALATWSMNLVAWSLHVEVFAAPFLPLFHALARRGNGWLDLAAVAALLGLALLAWPLVGARYLFAFYLGMTIEHRGAALVAAVERRLGGPRRAVALVYLAMMLPNTVAAQRSFGIAVVEALGAFLLVGLVVRSEGRRPLATLEAPMLRTNGRLSYSFYLWHLVLLTLAAHALYATLPPDAMVAWQVPLAAAVAVATIAVALAIAWASYRYVEVPGVALGRWLATPGRIAQLRNSAITR